MTPVPSFPNCLNLTCDVHVDVRVGGEVDLVGVQGGQHVAVVVSHQLNLMGLPNIIIFLYRILGKKLWIHINLLIF